MRDVYSVLDVDFQLTGLEESFIAAESIYDSHTNPVMPHVVQDVPQTCPNDSHINVDRLNFCFCVHLRLKFA